MSNKINVGKLFLAVVVGASSALSGATTCLADSKSEAVHEEKQHNLAERHKEYVYGRPIVPTAEWIMSSGGRLYDNWMASTDREMKDTHPSWPATNTKKSGDVTWRCKSCHGWDYKGASGTYGSGSYMTGVGGVTHMQGTDPSRMVEIVRNDTHKYTQEMITDDEAKRIGFFLSRGLHDTDAYIDRQSGAVSGSASRGAKVFQNVCAACHGFQGTKLDWGEKDEHAFVGTEANANPWEVLHKIRNGHPGHEMVSMRPFGLDLAVDILTYVRTLPTE